MTVSLEKEEQKPQVCLFLNLDFSQSASLLQYLNREIENCSAHLPSFKELELRIFDLHKATYFFGHTACLVLAFVYLQLLSLLLVKESESCNGWK